MNSFITVAYKANGTSEILAMPDVPYAKQREIFKTLKGGYAEVEVWSRSMGKIKQRKVSKESKIPKTSKTPKE